MTEHSAPAAISALRDELRAFVDRWASVSSRYDPSELEIPASVWAAGNAALVNAGYDPKSAGEEQKAVAHAPALREWAKETWLPPANATVDELDDLKLWRKVDAAPGKWWIRQDQAAQDFVSGQAASLFLGTFAPLAAKIVQAIGREHWPAEPPDPPEIRDAIRPDALAAELFGIASNNTLEAGKLCLLWGAMAHEPKAFYRPKGWPRKLTTWTQHLIVRLGSGNGYRTMGQPIEWALDAFDHLAASGKSDAKAGEPTAKKSMRSTQRGGARAKLSAALTKHHQYADGGCLNAEPINSNALAELANVSKSTASEFFKKVFRGYDQYQITCRDNALLIIALKALNDDFIPDILARARPVREIDGARDDNDED